MNKVKEEQLENFKIKYKKHIFSKCIKITLKQEGDILVTMPILCPFKTAREFLIKNFEKFKNYKFKKKVFNEDFKTKFDSLKIIKSDNFSIETKKNVVYFSYPKKSDFSSEIVQEKFLEAYKRALKIEAKNYLINRITFLANKYGFKFNKIALKSQRTRFGSCSYQNNINLNISLMTYDFDVIDYVLIHELVHTKIKNHSSLFWAEVEKFCPDYRILRKKLKSASFS